MQFLKKHPVIVSLVVLAVLGIVLAVTLRSGGGSLPADAVGTVVSPVEGAASAVTGEDGTLPAEWTTDGVHLNSAGCRKWLEYLRENPF